MTEPEIETLWSLLDTEDQRLPLMTAGEARAAAILLWHLGNGDADQRNMLDIARHLSSAIARRLPERDSSATAG